MCLIEKFCPILEKLSIQPKNSRILEVHAKPLRCMWNNFYQVQAARH